MEALYCMRGRGSAFVGQIPWGSVNLGRPELEYVVPVVVGVNGTLMESVQQIPWGIVDLEHRELGAAVSLMVVVNCDIVLAVNGTLMVSVRRIHAVGET